jgi:hypothetical protein
MFIRGRDFCGAEGDRTPDLVNAIHALSQLSYSPLEILSIIVIKIVTTINPFLGRCRTRLLAIVLHHCGLIGSTQGRISISDESRLVREQCRLLLPID